MTITLYKSTAENNRVDKTNYITQVTSLSGTLREQTNILNPSVLIELNTVPVFNYAYIPEFNRYYFVNNIESYRNNLWRIDMHVDVLMSYHSGIEWLNCLVARNEFTYNDYLVDNLVPVEKTPVITVTEITNNVLSKEESTYPFVVSHTAVASV